MIYQANIGIITKTWILPLSSYTQSNCQCTLTDDGYRIYRPPNKNPSSDGNTMWGGFVLRFYEPPFTKGHRYMINFDIKGKTSNGRDIQWSNQCGWGGGGLSPAPSDVIINDITSGVIYTDWFPFAYAWTINDDVYKTCTSSYSSFVAGTVYPSYRDFKYGFGYQDTGALGSDLYIKNVRMYDLTTATKIDIKKTGIIEGDSFNETLSPQSAAFHHSGEVSSNCFYEI